MNKWPHRNSFRYKIPSGTRHKFSQEKQQVFLAEFSFFFALPLQGRSPHLSVSSMAACLAGGVLLESLLMLTTTGYLECFSRRKLIFVSLLMRGAAFLTSYLTWSLSGWLLFFLLIAVSKSVSKPFLREILAETLSGQQLKKALNTFSLCCWY